MTRTVRPGNSCSRRHHRARPHQYAMEAFFPRVALVLVGSSALILFAVSTSAESTAAGGGGVGGGGEKRYAPVIREDPADASVVKESPVTLNCKADGNPEPDVVWFKDGRPFPPDGGDDGGGARRPDVMLLDGALFFLDVTRRDVGVYWCVARNSEGVAKSQNATLSIAHITDDFKTAPKDTRVPEGKLARLECDPPKASPTPSVTWLRNDRPVSVADVSDGSGRSRVRLADDSFDLTIGDARKEDEGTYVCQAENAAGIRRSGSARLTVLVRPFFIEKPTDVTAGIGEEVTVHCSVGGDPLPRVSWRRVVVVPPSSSSSSSSSRDAGDEKSVPVRQLGPGKLRNQGEAVLKFASVAADDAGRYFCVAENEVGKIRSDVSVSVTAPPAAQVRPASVHSLVGDSISLSCEVRGSPRPKILWTKAGKPRDVYFFKHFRGSSTGGNSSSASTSPTTDSDRIAVSADGQLDIRSVVVADGGPWTCWALSPSGSAGAAASLSVAATPADLPPPVVVDGPRNLTVPVRATAVFPCRAVATMGRPSKAPPSAAAAAAGVGSVAVSWSRDGMRITEFVTQGRARIFENGTLVVNDLTIDDSGLYKCTAASATGETSVSSTLEVLPSSSFTAALRQKIARLAPSPPGPPGIPEVVDLTEEGLRLSWESSQGSRESDFLGYSVFYYMPGFPEGRSSWTAAALRVHGHDAVIPGIRPDLRYVFLVRAENSAGFSAPSGLSKEVRFTAEEAREGRLRDWRRLESCAVRLVKAKPESPTAVRLTWEVDDETVKLDGLYIRYRRVGPDDDGSSESSEYSTETLMTSDHSVISALVAGLRPFSTHEFFVVPFWKGRQGCPSNTMAAKTPEGVPTSAPSSIKVAALNSTSVLITWDEVPPVDVNGVLEGYQLRISSLHSPHPFKIMVRNASSDSFLLHGLSPGGTHELSIAALTRAGVGPFSPRMRFSTTAAAAASGGGSSITSEDSAGTAATGESADSPPLVNNHVPGNTGAIDVAREAWIIGAAGGVLFVLLGIFVVVVAVKRRRANKRGERTYLESEKVLGMCYLNGSKQEPYWMDPSWKYGGDGSGGPGTSESEKFLSFSVRDGGREATEDGAGGQRHQPVLLGKQQASGSGSSTSNVSGTAGSSSGSGNDQQLPRRGARPAPPPSRHQQTGGGCGDDDEDDRRSSDELRPGEEKQYSSIFEAEDLGADVRDDGEGGSNRKAFLPSNGSSCFGGRPPVPSSSPVPYASSSVYQHNASSDGGARLLAGFSLDKDDGFRGGGSFGGHRQQDRLHSGVAFSSFGVGGRGNPRRGLLHYNDNGSAPSMAPATAASDAGRILAGSAVGRAYCWTPVMVRTGETYDGRRGPLPTRDNRDVGDGGGGSSSRQQNWPDFFPPPPPPLETAVGAKNGRAFSDRGSAGSRLDSDEKHGSYQKLRHERRQQQQQQAGNSAGGAFVPGPDGSIVNGRPNKTRRSSPSSSNDDRVGRSSPPPPPPSSSFVSAENGGGGGRRSAGSSTTALSDHLYSDAFGPIIRDFLENHKDLLLPTNNYERIVGFDGDGSASRPRDDRAPTDPSTSVTSNRGIQSSRTPSPPSSRNRGFRICNSKPRRTNQSHHQQQQQNEYSDLESMSICGATSADEDDDTSYAGILSLRRDDEADDEEDRRGNKDLGRGAATTMRYCFSDGDGDGDGDGDCEGDGDEGEGCSVASGGSLGPKRVALYIDGDYDKKNGGDVKDCFFAPEFSEAFEAFKSGSLAACYPRPPPFKESSGNSSSINFGETRGMNAFQADVTPEAPKYSPPSSSNHKSNDVVRENLQKIYHRQSSERQTGSGVREAQV